MVEMVEPVSKTQMLIRQPAPTVFEAFVDPDVTTRFWFTHSTGEIEKRRQGSLGVAHVRRFG